MMDYKKKYLKYKKKYIELLKGGNPGKQASNSEEPEFIPYELPFKIKDIVMVDGEHYIITDLNVRIMTFGGNNYSYNYELFSLDLRKKIRALNNQVKIVMNENIPSITQFASNILKVRTEIDEKIKQKGLEREQLELVSQRKKEIRRLEIDIQRNEVALEGKINERAKFDHDSDEPYTFELDKSITRREKELEQNQAKLEQLKKYGIV